MLTIVLKEGANPVTYNLDEDVISIGRSKENNIVLKNIKSSRRHARIERTGAVYQLTDLGSGNGTKVNGSKIDIHALKQGDEIKIGDALLTLKAIDEGVDAMDVPDGDDELKLKDDDKDEIKIADDADEHKLEIVGEDDTADKDTERIAWSEAETEVQAPSVQAKPATKSVPAAKPGLGAKLGLAKPGAKPGAAPAPAAKPLLKKPLGGRQAPK